jgi:hypothetical protein
MNFLELFDQRRAASNVIVCLSVYYQDLLLFFQEWLTLLVTFLY